MKKKKTNKIIIVMACLLIVLIIIFYPYFKPRKVVWCYFELNSTDIPRNECTHLKLISRDIEQVDFEKFLALNVTDVGCYDSYKEMPVCSGKEHYFTKLDLTELSEVKVDGVVCAAYYITFYESNDTLTGFKQDLYRVQDFKEEVSSEELKKLIEECEV